MIAESHGPIMLPIGDVAPAVFGVAALAPGIETTSVSEPDLGESERTHHSAHHGVRHAAHCRIRSHFV